MKRTPLKRKTPLKAKRFLVDSRNIPSLCKLSKQKQKGSFIPTQEIWINPPTKKELRWAKKMDRVHEGIGLRKTPLNKVSDKQKVKNALWVKVKAERIELLIKKYGFLPDEFTGKPIKEGDIIDGHHNDRNRNHNYLSNCRILIRASHDFVTDNNIKGVPDLLK